LKLHERFDVAVLHDPAREVVALKGFPHLGQSRFSFIATPDGAADPDMGEGLQATDWVWILLVVMFPSNIIQDV